MADVSRYLRVSEKATKQADFMREGMEDEVQSINVVRYPLARFRKS